MTLPPWLQPIWAQTVRAADTLHHAILISGVPGLAKREFALALGRYILCAEPQGEQPCGHCRSCTLFRAATHPDFHVLATEQEGRDGRIDLIRDYCIRYQNAAARDKRAQPGRVIGIDQVRLLGERFGVHAHTAARKVALLVAADRLNLNAANALLKLLEEPPSDSVLMLVTAHPSHLPPTILSRCVRIPIPVPPRETALAWLGEQLSAQEANTALALTHGAPLAAQHLARDGGLAQQHEWRQAATALGARQRSAVAIATDFGRADFSVWIEWLHRYSCDLIRTAVGVAPAAGEAAHGQAAPQAAFALYDRVGAYRKIARDQINEQLAVEELTMWLQRALAS